MESFIEYSEFNDLNRSAIAKDGVVPYLVMLKKTCNNLYIKLPDKFIEYLITGGFFSAPASTKYHGAYPGGLFEHSYIVADNLCKMTNQLGLKWDVFDDSLNDWMGIKLRNIAIPFIIGIFHDICKIDNYYLSTDDNTTDSKFVYKYSKERLELGHGKRSLDILSQYGVHISEEMSYCIAYHMGTWTNEKDYLSPNIDYSKAVDKYKNVLFTHTADMMESRDIRFSMDNSIKYS